MSNIPELSRDSSSCYILDIVILKRLGGVTFSYQYIWPILSVPYSASCVWIFLLGRSVHGGHLTLSKGL